MIRHNNLIVKNYILLTILIFYYIQSFTQTEIPVVKGRSFIQNFYPEEYKGIPYTSSIEIDKNGLVYAANAKGLLNYNSKEWSIINTNKLIPNTLGKDHLGRILIAGDKDFGYIDCDSTGNYILKSLRKKVDFKGDTFNITKIMLTKNNVIFARNNYLFSWNYDTVTTHYFPEGFKDVITVEDRIFILKENLQLIEIYNNKEINILTNNHYRITDIKTYKDNDLFLVSTLNSGLFLLKKNILEKIETNADEYFSKYGIRKLIYTKGGNIIIATNLGGVVILDSNFNITQVYNKTTGLQSESIRDMKYDGQNLWLALTSGISKIEPNTPIYYFSEDDGVSGMILDIKKFNNKFYIASTTGLYYSEIKTQLKDSKQALFYFKKVKNSQNDSRALLVYKNRLYAISGYSIVEIKNNSTYTLSSENIYPLTIAPHTSDTTKLLIGTVNGLKTLDLNTHKTSDFNKSVHGSIRSICKNKKNNLWINTYRNGIYQLQINNDSIITQHFDTTNALPANSGNQICFLNNKHFIKTSKGIYKINPEDIKQFIPNPDFLPLPNNEDKLTEISIQSEEKVWGIINMQSPGLYSKLPNGQYKWFDMAFKRLPKVSVFSLFIDTTQHATWFGSSKGIFVYKNNNNYNFAPKHTPVITKIHTNNDSIVRAYYNGNSKRLVKDILKYKNNSLVFEYCLPYYSQSNKNKYQIKLEGFDENFSKWNLDNKKEYTNLPPGEYTFIVKGKNIYDLESPKCIYSFKILPPWYIKIWMFPIYTILIVLIVYLFIQVHTKRLKKANKKLEDIVFKRTKELQKQKKEIELKNIELEKLSIVAAEVDNTVIIADISGKIEWINPAFTKLTGYEFEEFISLFGDTIHQTSSNVHVNFYINDCIKTKKSVTYISKSFSKKGSSFWMQTTLNPIINNKGEVIKLIAIDSNITKLKEAEEEILQQKEEIITQKDEIEIQKELLSKNNELLKYKNAQITDSINYARRIQQAFLTSLDIIKSKFKDSFILYKPKDIVSGDFLWMYENNDYTFLIAADCTGHGVPGALMSIIGSTLLKEIIVFNGETETDIILKTLNTNVLNALSISDSIDINKSATVKDGMDISIVRFSKDMYNLQISAANQHPIIFTEDDKIIVKGDYYSIGEKRVEKKKLNYTAYNYNLEKDYTLYLFSDGFYDQANPKYEKYHRTRFYKLLESQHSLPTKTQEKNFESELDNWKNTASQTDDILVVGIKIDGK